MTFEYGTPAPPSDGIYTPKVSLKCLLKKVMYSSVTVVVPPDYKTYT